MNWKTCSVEAGSGIGKRVSNPRCQPAFDRPSGHALSGIRLPTAPANLSESGMQKHGLTMFAATCYSSLVPRVHPGLLCAVSFGRDCVRETCGGAIEKCVSE